MLSHSQGSLYSVTDAVLLDGHRTRCIGTNLYRCTTCTLGLGSFDQAPLMFSKGRLSKMPFRMDNVLEWLFWYMDESKGLGCERVG
jgi:hypothetical protein